MFVCMFLYVTRLLCRRNGLYLGEVVSIGYAINDAKPTVLQRIPGDSEEGILNAFKDVIKRPDLIYVGHNIRGFDLPFLWRRGIINNTHLDLPVFEISPKKGI